MNVTLILIVLLVGAIVTYLAGDKLASKVSLFFGVVSFGLTVYLLQLFNEGQNIAFFSKWITNPNINFVLSVDGLSIAMVLLTTSLTSLIIFSSFDNHFKNAKAIYSLILLMAFAMVGTFLAADGLLYYIFWELALIPIYFIALIWGNGDADERRKAVAKFFIYTFAGSLFMLVAFIYMYNKAGSLLIGDLYAIKLNSKEEYLIFGAFFLAYAIKIPLIPFHTWQANVYQKAPTVGTMLLSGIMLKMGLYSVIRWQMPITPNVSKYFTETIVALGIAGVIYGSIVALRQNNLKKLLAYSSLAHVGLIAAGIYSLTLDGLRGAVLQMVAHGFVVVGLFLAAEVIERRYQTNSISDLGGIRAQSPKFSSMFMILVLASVALPSTFNFIGEFTILYSLAQVNVGLAILGGTTIILGAYYMLKMYQNVMLGKTNQKPFADVTFTEGTTFIIIIAVLLFFGLYPKPIFDLISPGIISTLDLINNTK